MKQTAPFLGICLVLCCFSVAAQSIEKLDPAMATPSADGAWLWFDALKLGLEGQGWTDLEQPFDRMPAAAKGVIRDAVWSLSKCTAGISVRFTTNSSSIAARWKPRNDRLDMPHMPATGVSGLDLYVKQDGVWGWIGNGRPEKPGVSETTLANDLPAGAHEYRIYLPLYNGVDSLEIGVTKDAEITRAPALPGGKDKPILFWGTSILQGGCASRPGLAYPSIVGRKLDRPTINLGFSGNGKMDPEIVEMIAKLDLAAYVIDCAPNMNPELITERTEPLVNALRAARPETPIVLVENVPYQQGWFIASKRAAYEDKNAALKAAYDRLVASGVAKLYYVPCTDLFGQDHEATVDGTHATDLGFMRMAEVIAPVLANILDVK